MLMNYLDIKPEVAKALKEGRAVVALESTIISHGMPYPRNIFYTLHQIYIILILPFYKHMLIVILITNIRNKFTS